MKKHVEHSFEQLIFASRWVQAPIYLGLIVGSVIYSYKFLVELFHLYRNVTEINEAHMMLGILTLIDITMVLNLLFMVIIGGYVTFIGICIETHNTDCPDWLEKVDAGVMKIKFTSALVGVSSIHLLKAFINIDEKNLQHVMWQIIIHFIFLVSTLMLAQTENLLHKKQSPETLS